MKRNKTTGNSGGNSAEQPEQTGQAGQTKLSVKKSSLLLILKSIARRISEESTATSKSISEGFLGDFNMARTSPGQFGGIFAKLGRKKFIAKISTSGPPVYQLTDKALKYLERHSRDSAATSKTGKGKRRGKGTPGHSATTTAASAIKPASSSIDGSLPSSLTLSSAPLQQQVAELEKCEDEYVRISDEIEEDVAALEAKRKRQNELSTLSDKLAQVKKILAGA